MLPEPRSSTSSPITRPATDGPRAEPFAEGDRKMRPVGNEHGRSDIPHEPSARNERATDGVQGRRLSKRWLRPFASLVWKLTFVFMALFLLFMLILDGLIYSFAASAPHAQTLLTFMIVTTAVILIVGSASAYVLIYTRLHPLRRMQDAAQAIAFGDLKQRARLPQGDNEVGALAASFNSMVDQLEHAFAAQRASEERTRRFLSDASHELRTPLTSLRGFTDVLIRGAKDDPEALQRSLRLMKQETERMSCLITDLLTLARFDTGRPLQTQQVNLVDMATEVVEQVKIQAIDGRTVSLRLPKPEERLEVMANVDRLKQVLLILFDNAMKYGRPGPDGWIVLELDEQDSYILMRVIDNGMGVAPDDASHIFERFYRGQRSPTAYGDSTKGTGAGLGLSIALAIVHAHSGEISVHSDSGKGTTFTVTLPGVHMDSSHHYTDVV